VWRFLFAIVPCGRSGFGAGRCHSAAPAGHQRRHRHANVHLWDPLDRVLSLFWVTPNMHKIHHSRVVSEANSNYANLVTLYDRLLGTYTPAERAHGVSYGLDDAEALGRASLSGLLSMPFHAPRRPGAPDTKVRIEVSAGR
jgi:hypothetical protein